MRVIADGDLAELLTTGNNRKYRDIARTPVLMNGLKRAVEILLSVSCVEELSDFSFLHYERLKYENAWLFLDKVVQSIHSSADLYGRAGQDYVETD